MFFAVNDKRQPLKKKNVVQDNFFPLVEGTDLGLHGPTRWFMGHTFVPVINASQKRKEAPKGSISHEETTIKSTKQQMKSTQQNFLIGLIAVLVSIYFVIQLYRRYLKPRVIREHLKKE